MTIQKLIDTIKTHDPVFFDAPTADVVDTLTRVLALVEAAEYVASLDDNDGAFDWCETTEPNPRKAILGIREKLAALKAAGDIEGKSTEEKR